MLINRLRIYLLSASIALASYFSHLNAAGPPPDESTTTAEDQGSPTVLILSIGAALIVVGGTAYYLIMKKNQREVDDMLKKTKEQLDKENKTKEIKLCFSNIIDENQRASDDTLGIRATAIINSVLDDDEKIKVEYQRDYFNYEDVNERKELAKKYPDAFYLSGSVMKKTDGEIVLTTVLYKFPLEKEIARLDRSFKEIDQISFFASELAEEMVKIIHKVYKSNDEQKKPLPDKVPDTK